MVQQVLLIRFAQVFDVLHKEDELLKSERLADEGRVHHRALFWVGLRIEVGVRCEGFLRCRVRLGVKIGVWGGAKIGVWRGAKPWAWRDGRPRI